MKNSPITHTVPKALTSGHAICCLDASVGWWWSSWRGDEIDAGYVTAKHVEDVRIPLLYLSLPLPHLNVLLRAGRTVDVIYYASICSQYLLFFSC